MKKLIISRAVLSALLLTSAAFATATVAPVTEGIVNNNGLEGTVAQASVATDIELSMNATGDKNPAKSNATSNFSFVSTIGDDANTVVISNAIANAFSTGGAGGLSIHSGSIKSIKNAPYRAEVINEDMQTLNDGNQIVKRTTQLSYRDSAGRTRTELNDANGNTRNITIYDAVEKITYNINPKQKVATKISVDPNFQKRIDELREKAKEMSRDGKSTLISRSPGEEIVISRIERPRGADGTTANEEVRVNVMRASDNVKLSALKLRELGALGAVGEVGALRIDATSVGGSPLTSFSGLNQNLAGLVSLTSSFADRAWSAKATTKELGTKDIDCIRAEGKLRAYTIPAGEVGNKNPITVSTETWVSPELQITLYSKHSDPRSGDKIYRLQNIKRSEQSLDLFNVPEGYQVKETPAMKFEVRSK